MTIEEIRTLLSDAIAPYRLLDHPFYRRWEAGQLVDGELAAYAEQYRVAEQALPTLLAAVAERLHEGRSRELVLENLHDELTVPMPHVALFESFARTAGARPEDEVPAGPAVGALVGSTRQAAERDPMAALAMIAAYEVQAAEVAATKSDGLRRHYGFEGSGTEFWDVHAAMEAAHADWSLEALARLVDGGESADRMASAAAAGAAGWWAFLDEREAEAALAS